MEVLTLCCNVCQPDINLSKTDNAEKRNSDLEKEKEEDERKKAQLRESQVALSRKLEELRIQSRSTAREGLMLRHQVRTD